MQDNGYDCVCLLWKLLSFSRRQILYDTHGFIPCNDKLISIFIFKATIRSVTLIIYLNIHIPLCA